MNILNQAKEKISYFNAIGIHYEAVYHYVINRRNKTDEIYTDDYIDDIVAGLISFDMQRMMGNVKYLRDGDKSWAARLKKLLDKNKKVLQDLRPYTLPEIDLSNQAICNKIIRLFENLSQSGPKGLNLIGNRRFPVGASKILHFLIPDLFIIIDSNARKELSYFYGIKKNRELDGDLYLEVMRLYQNELQNWTSEKKDKNFKKLQNLDTSFKRFSSRQKVPIPRIIDKCTFVGSENLDAREIDYLPEKFEVGIGGYLGTSYGAEIDGKRLIYKTYGDRYKLLNTQEINPTEDQWLTFWTAINKINIWEWETRYEDPGVMDGTSWRVCIQYGNRSIESSGSNKYPGGTDDAKDFGLFLRAFRKLLGRVAFN